MNQSARRTQPPAARRGAPGWCALGGGRWAPLVIASALLPLAAFPPLEWPALAWVALVPLLLALRHGAGGPGAWAATGWLYGLVYWGVQYAWLHHAFVVQAGMGWLHFANFFALAVALLALGPALALAAARWAWLRWGLTPMATLPVLLAAQDAVLGAWPFGGLAWGSLAGPQAGTLAARAIVPVLGGAGLVLLLGGVNAAWAAWVARLRGGAPARGALGAAALGLLTALCAWPAPPAVQPAGVEPAATPGAALSVLLVPGDLSLAELRDASAPLRHYLGRTLAALAAPAAPAAGTAQPPATRSADAPRRTLVLWPESAVPGVLEPGGRALGGRAPGGPLAELAQVGALLGVDFLLGANARVRERETNALFLVRGATGEVARYDKRRLVPFGEYVPAGFGWLFPRKLTAGAEDYAAGAGAPVLEWQGERLGLAICFETMLPGTVREAVQAGATVLVGAANDAWLTPAARRQHLQLTALRGLEAGRDVLFVANRGWSGLLRGGRALALSPRAPLRVQAVPRRGRTPFVRWGAWPLAGAAALVLLAAWWGRRVEAPRPARSHNSTSATDER
jgi:apolipoprotein N-acyltransferase